MNERAPENEAIERLLKRARLAEPSADLRSRVVGAMKDAWQEAPPEVPWQIPLRRLGLSAAAAVLLISGANYYSTWSVAHWHAGPRLAARMTAADFDDTPEIPYGPFVQHLIAVRRSSARDSALLLQYVGRSHDPGDGLEGIETTDEPDTLERRSRLVPVGSGAGWRA